MSEYDFKLLGHSLSFAAELNGHIVLGEMDRIKDYICGAYNTYDPNMYDMHPCYSEIKSGIQYLRDHHWKLLIGNWNEIGTQIILVSPTEDYYHSNFRHSNVTILSKRGKNFNKTKYTGRSITR